MGLGKTKTKQKSKAKVMAPEATLVGEKLKEETKELFGEEIKIGKISLKRFLNDQLATPCIRNICHFALSDSFALEMRYCDFFLVDENVYFDDAGQDEKRLEFLLSKKEALTKLKQDENYFIYFKGELYGVDNGNI